MAFLGFGRKKEERQQALVQQASQSGRTFLGGLFGRDAYSQAWKAQRKEAIDQYRLQKRQLYDQLRRQEQKTRQQQLPRQEKRVLQHYDLPQRPSGPVSHLTWPQRQAAKKIARIEKHTWRDFRRQKQDQLRDLRRQRNEQVKQISVRLQEQTSFKNNAGSVTPGRPVTPFRTS